MNKLVKKYSFAIVSFCLLIILFIVNHTLAKTAVKHSLLSIKEMLFVIPPIFILLGLLDVWVSKDSMVKYMGEKSGLKGILLAIFLGSAAAGPLYGAFPVASMLMKKGVKFSNILIFIGAWSTTKLPMLLFEIVTMGKTFALLRLLIDIPGIIIIAHLISVFVSKKDIEQIIEKQCKIGL